MNKELKKGSFYWLFYDNQKTIGQYDGKYFEIIGRSRLYLPNDFDSIGEEIEEEYTNDGK